AFTAICLGMAIAGALGAMLLGVESPIVLPTVVWWLCYATAFYCAQCLVALGAPGAGSFFFYPAPTLALLFSLVPYLVLVDDPPLPGILMAAIAGAAPIALCAIAWVVHTLKRGDWPHN